MIVAKILLILVFILAWLKSRRSRQAEPSDFFVLSFLLIYVPGFLFNPTGQTSLNGLHLGEAAARRAEFGMMMVLGISTLMFTVRKYVEQKFPALTTLSKAFTSSRISGFFAGVAAIFTVVFIAGLLLNADFREFKLDTLKFLTFQFQGIDYRFVRNEKFSATWLIESFLGRARFTILPILFCFAIYPLLTRKKIVFGILAATAIFVALPASLSKLPIFFFCGYGVILVATRYPRFLDIRLLSAMLFIVATIIVTMLVVLYTAQYQNSVIGGAVLPLNLAVERIWGETYSVVVRYFAVYPDMLPFTGLSGINVLAKLSGIPPRLPDVEVALILLGPDSGSNPGVFFLGGYAAFGTVGLCTFALLGPLVLWCLDFIGRRIQTEPIRATYLAVLGMNAVFLNQIALQTALLTYGLAIVPIFLFFLDRVFLKVWLPRRIPGESKPTNGVFNAVDEG